jgi:hypothetical protein
MMQMSTVPLVMKTVLLTVTGTNILTMRMNVSNAMRLVLVAARMETCALNATLLAELVLAQEVMIACIVSRVLRGNTQLWQLVAARVKNPVGTTWLTDQTVVVVKKYPVGAEARTPSTALLVKMIGAYNVAMARIGSTENVTSVENVTVMTLKSVT